MSFLRTIRQPFLRPLTRTTPRVALTNRRHASDYGSPEGDMVKESPKDRPKNPSEGLEHPGPPPPSAAQKGNDASQQTSGKGSSSSDKSSGGSGSGNGSSSSSSKGTQGAQPKILNESPPQGESVPEDVRKHNREMDQRAEQAAQKVQDEDIEKDKVGKNFWAGKGGADREP